MMAQGATAAGAGTGQVVTALSKNFLDRSGGGKTGRKLSNDRLERQQEAVDQLRDERDALRSQPNKTPEDKAALAAKERELNRAIDRLKASEEHARKAQGSN